MTLAEAEAKLAIYEAALDTVAAGRAYSIESGGSSRSLTRQDLDEIRKTIDWLEGKITKLQATAGGNRVSYVNG